MPAEQLNISLPPKMARFIRAKVKSGRYANPGEAVLDAVRMMQDAEVVALRDEVMQGVEEVERGECLEFDEKGLKAFFRDVNIRGRERFEGGRKQR
ncbi:MAG: type II toxin-antitoxin system ParD family antitoxin [Acidobacteria bacterium]|nr:type II toxin-antitoxin system ParD family antitoxin [Acidobacteriota bacterium]